MKDFNNFQRLDLVTNYLKTYEGNQKLHTFFKFLTTSKRAISSQQQQELLMTTPIKTFKTLREISNLSESEFRAYEAFSSLSSNEQAKALEIEAITTALGSKQFRNTRYSITSDGKILNTKTGKFISTHHMLDRPYVRATLVVDGKICSFLVHRLVAEVFLSNPDNLTCVDHVNNNSRDNRVSNLRWISVQGNHTHKTSQNRQAAKLTPTEVIAIRGLVSNGHTMTSLAKKFQITYGAIFAVVKRISWRHI